LLKKSAFLVSFENFSLTIKDQESNPPEKSIHCSRS